MPSGSANPKISQYSSEWEFLKSIGVKLGVPEERILKEDQARNTFDNAEFSWRVIKESVKDPRETAEKVIMVEVLKA